VNPCPTHSQYLLPAHSKPSASCHPGVWEMAPVAEDGEESGWKRACAAPWISCFIRLFPQELTQPKPRNWQGFFASLGQK